MSDVPGSVQPVKALIRRDIVEVLGDDLESVLQVVNAYMTDALVTVLVRYQRYHCKNCKTAQLMRDFFPWLNNEGYKHIIENFDHEVFMQECVSWAHKWSKEQMASPCTDGMPSSRVH